MLATQLFTWVSTIIVVRLLTPHDYGIVSMAMIYIGFVQMVSEFGLSAAVVQQRGLTSLKAGAATSPTARSAEC